MFGEKIFAPKAMVLVEPVNYKGFGFNCFCSTTTRLNSVRREGGNDEWGIIVFLHKVIKYR